MLYDKDRDLKLNASGCPDPTAYEAIKNLDADAERVSKVIGCIRRICDIAGFSIQGRIVLVDYENGKVWR